MEESNRMKWRTYANIEKCPESPMNQKEIDPDWKKKLTDCLKSLGILTIAFGQISLNVADGRVMDATRQDKLK